MLKKAGIVVAAAAAGLLAVSPLAFAGSKGDDHGHGGGDKQVNKVDESREGGQNRQLGLINVGDVNALNDNQVNVCPNVQVGVGNIIGLLGAVDQDAEAECTNEDNITQVNKS